MRWITSRGNVKEHWGVLGYHRRLSTETESRFDYGRATLPSLSKLSFRSASYGDNSGLSARYLKRDAILFPSTGEGRGFSRQLASSVSH